MKKLTLAQPKENEIGLGDIEPHHLVVARKACGKVYRIHAKASDIWAVYSMSGKQETMFHGRLDQLAIHLECKIIAIYDMRGPH